MVLEMGGRWPYSCCLAGCYIQDLFYTARSILMKLLFSFFSIRLVSVHMVHPYGSIDTTAAWKKSRFILSDRSDFHIIDSLSMAVHAFVWHILTLVSLHETMLPRYVNFSTNFRVPSFRVEMAPSRLKHMYSVFCWFFFFCVYKVANASRYPLQAMQQGFGLGQLIFDKRYVICIVGVHYSFCGISSASYLFYVKLFSFIRSIVFLGTKSRQVIYRYGAHVFPCRTPATIWVI